MAKITIGVIGGDIASDKDLVLAYEVGKHIAQNSAVLICGGLGGIMEATSRGTKENGGTVIGILPGNDKKNANSFVDIVLPTGIGEARNVLVSNCSDVLIAFPGSYGTLSEMAFALNSGKTVVYMPGAWNLLRIGQVETAFFKEAHEPQQAVGLALNAAMNTI